MITLQYIYIYYIQYFHLFIAEEGREEWRGEAPDQPLLPAALRCGDFRNQRWRWRRCRIRRSFQGLSEQRQPSEYKVANIPSRMFIRDRTIIKEITVPCQM